MPAIRSTQDIANKWKTVTPGRSSEYEAGIINPLGDWVKATLAAKDAQKAGITQALAQGRFEKGVAKAGNATWQERTKLLGVRRWGEGVSVSGDRYANGFDPYQKVIATTVLPPRGPNGDPRNNERTKAMSEALAKKKATG